MENLNLIERLHRELDSFNNDVRAEVLLALAIEGRLEPKDFLVSCDGLFSRDYQKDISATEIKETAHLTTLVLHLSRSGLYDHLPEGIFYTPSVSIKKNSAGEMAHEYRENQKKEDFCRRFFLPFEYSFFLQRLQLESEETRLLNSIYSGNLNDDFLQFWDIPASLPKAFGKSLILLLPHANKIVGDISLTEECLEYLIEEVVEIIPTSKNVAANNSFVSVLGKLSLGLDTICGEQFCEENSCFRICIGPIKKSSFFDYTDGGIMNKFLNTFYQFFVPAGVEVVTDIIVTPEESHFQLCVEDEPILGYTSIF